MPDKPADASSLPGEPGKSALKVYDIEIDISVRGTIHVEASSIEEAREKAGRVECVTCDPFLSGPYIDEFEEGIIDIEIEAVWEREDWEADDETPSGE